MLRGEGGDEKIVTDEIDDARDAAFHLIADTLIAICDKTIVASVAQRDKTEQATVGEVRPLAVVEPSGRTVDSGNQSEAAKKFPWWVLGVAFVLIAWLVIMMQVRQIN